MRFSSFVVSLALLLPAFNAAAEDWPRWRGPRGDGTWNAPAIPDKWPASGLKPVWKQPLAPGYSGISVAAGRVYTMDRPWADDAKETPADAERILCFDAVRGEPLWEHRYDASYSKIDYPKGPRCTPTVHAGRVYTLGAAGHLHCLDASSGKVLWSHDLVTESQARIPDWGLAASPVIEGNLVIVHAGLEKGGCYSAYDRRTGEEVWRSGDDPAGYGTPIVVDHAGIRLLIGWNPEHIVGINAANGKLLWKVAYKVQLGVSIATPIFQEGIVLVCGYWDGSKAIKLGERPEDAEIVWEENRFLRGLMDQPVYRGGVGYLLDKQHGIVAFRLASGEKLWTDGNQLHPRDRNPQVSMVWLGDSDRAIALNAQGELILVRLTPDGLTEQSRSKIVGHTWAHPAYAGDCVHARDDEQLVCVRLTDK
jgi:outer membrane protein assembly factor BamB